MHLTYPLPLLSSMLFTALINAEPFKCNPPTIQPVNTVQVPFCCKIAAWAFSVFRQPQEQGVRTYFQQRLRQVRTRIVVATDCV